MTVEFMHYQRNFLSGIGIEVKKLVSGNEIEGTIRPPI